MKKCLVMSLVALTGLSQATELFLNGPVVNGNNQSVMPAAASNLGYGAQGSAGNLLAEDFVVTGGGWNITSLDFFAYQTGSTSFTFQTAVWSIMTGTPNGGTVLASGTTAVTNGGFVGYRVPSADLTDVQRGIYRVQADIPDIALAAGTYWLTWGLTGSLASGPWSPPTSDFAVGNSMQQVGAGTTWVRTLDPRSGQNVSLPFAIQGSVAAVPEPASVAMMLAGGLAVVGLSRRRRIG